MNKCLTCDKEVERKFCNHSCRAKYTNVHRKYKPSSDKRTKSVKCKKCQSIIEVNIRSNSENCLCNKCRDYTLTRNKSGKISILKKSVCSCCGSNNCKKKICRWYKAGGNKTFKKLGLDTSKEGSEEIFLEILKLKDTIVNLYFDEGLSLPELQNKTGIWVRSFQVFFNLFDLKLRNLSDSISLNRVKHPEQTFCFIEHKTWDGRDVILRSKNELNIALSLDEQKLIYFVEHFRIPYLDSLGNERNYIPDFYIPSENLLIEAKGSYYENEDCKHKADAARKMGYNYKYILDGIETVI